MPDCVGTLLENGGFDSDATAWQAGENTEMAWSVNDGGVRRTSGSLELTSPAPVASASQCIAFDAAPLLVTWGQTFIEPSAQAQTQAWIEVQLFAQPDCQGDPSGFFDTPASSAMGGWNVVQAGGIAGSDTHSVRVSVNALAPHDLAKTPVRFDNVMLKAKPLD
jgi:hypothetical protein